MNIEESKTIVVSSMESLEFVGAKFIEKYRDIVASKFVKKSISSIKVAVITTAQKDAKENKNTHPWTLNVINLFLKIGFSTENISLVDLEYEPEKIHFIRDADIIHIKGGDYYHLQKYLDRHKINEILAEKAVSGVVSGTSAGAVALGGTSTFVEKIFDEKNNTEIPLEKFSGAGLLPFDDKNILLLHEEWVDEQRLNNYLTENHASVVVSIKNSELISFHKGMVHKLYDNGQFGLLS